MCKLGAQQLWFSTDDGGGLCHIYLLRHIYIRKLIAVDFQSFIIYTYIHVIINQRRLFRNYLSFQLQWSKRCDT